MTDGGRGHLAVIRNPTAGGARGAKFDAVVASLRAAGCRVDLHDSSSAGDVTRLAAVLSQGDHEALAVAGGDGTINDAVNGLVPEAGMPFGIIPLGTANVLAWELGLAEAGPAALAEALRFGAARQVHLGRLYSSAAQRSREGAAEGRLFFLMAGVGFDAAVVDGVDLALKRRVGKLAYVWEALQQLFLNSFPCFDLEIDGRQEEAAGVVVAKARHYGGRYLCAAEADLADPSFQVCLFRRRGGISTLRYAVALARGTLPRLADFETHRAQEISITAPEGAPLQVDGDPAGRLPARIRLAEETLNLIYPKH